MGVNQGAQQSAMEKLSSGMRINRAGDDAAGLAISEKMRGQIRGLDQASRNAQDGISLIQTAEGSLNEAHNILQRMRELAVQSANDTNTNDDRGELQKELEQLQAELGRIETDTEFNTMTLLNGDIDDEQIHIGANAGQVLEISIEALSTTVSDALGASIDDQTSADTAITEIDDSIKALSGERSQLGAWQNRLEHTINNLDNASENLQAAESRIRDVDMAAEMMEMTRANILSQASQSMLAQANQQPQSVLQLLG